MVVRDPGQVRRQEVLQPIKRYIKARLQRILGYRRYLRLFSIFKIKTLGFDSRERGFMYFLSMLPERGVVLDIGANLGFLTVHLAKKVKDGHVLAFEPMPDNLDTLRYIVSRFKLSNVVIEPCALGEQEGLVDMVLPMRGKSREQGLCHVLTAEEGSNGGEVVCVPMRKLDNISGLLSDEDGERVVGIKIDVENFESHVLKGGLNVIQHHRPLIYLELMDNENRQCCLELARTVGYEPKVFSDGELVNFDQRTHADCINMFLLYRGSCGSQ